MKLQPNDPFYEKAGMETIPYTVLKAPVLQDNAGARSLLWSGIDEAGEEVEFFLTQGMEHYGPEIFSQTSASSMK